MPIRLLSETEFDRTMISPMRDMNEGEEITAAGLSEYVTACIQAEALPVALDDMEIERVYISGGNKYQHVLLDYGLPNRYLVIVIALPSGEIFGHHLLDLNKKYGLDAPE